ncbi:MAG TPA: adenylate/guanylate cyclase domain-containing protein [Usitatibacteraceae bacterium]|nr:adenylate/guanylate cyclase domain-containing protein [Usitatibacteraceae bacterium]
MALNARWFPKPSLNDVIRAAIGIAVVFFFLVHEAEWQEFRFLQQLELWAYDARIRLFLPKTRDTRVVILDIDEKSLNAEGRFPWPRNKLALMLKQLFEHYQVRVVGFDIALPEPDTSSGLPIFEALAKGELKDNAEYQAFLRGARASLDYDKVLADEIAKWPVVLGVAMGGKEDVAGVLPAPVFEARALGEAEYPHYTSTGYSGNIAILQKASTATGHFYPALDIDGVTRRVPMFMLYKDGYYEALSLAVARTYLGNAAVKIVLDEPRRYGPRLEGWMRSIRIGEVEVPLDRAMTATVPYRAAGGFRYVSATDVLRGTLPAGELKDKIIIVGTSAQGLVDLRATPVQEDLPGVEVHATLVSGILDGTIKNRPPEVLGITAVLIALIGIPLAIVLPRLSALWSTAAVAALFALVVATNLYLWNARNWVVPIASGLLMLVLLYFLNMVYGFFAEARSRRLITGLFGTYVPKELVDEMAKNPGHYSMKGESREMTVLFSDIRDFTSISEGLTPENLKELMNTYLTAMTEEVQEKRGTIDKYIGDAIMAFWGAPLADPDHATHALETGIAMQKGLRGLDAPFAKRGWPPLHIGVGINCGMMNVGDMGSKFRRSYTVIGDAVNLASRLESLTKEYGVGILVSENIVRKATAFVYRDIDKVRVKGKHEGVGIFEPAGRQGEVGDETLREIERFHKALEAYRAQRWDDAEKMLKNLAYAAPEMKLYKLYLERVAHFRASPPPANWDGVFVFTTK